MLVGLFVMFSCVTLNTFAKVFAHIICNGMLLFLLLFFDDCVYLIGCLTLHVLSK